MPYDKIDHTHGSSGNKPPSDLNFDDGEYPNPEHFDWFWSHVVDAINAHAGSLDGIDSDTDGIVDEAEVAQIAEGLTQAVLDTLADDPHGDAAHSETYATEAYAAADPHGNGAHSSTFAESPHGNAAHSETYAYPTDPVEQFTTNGGDGTVPVAQTDGSIQMQEPFFGGDGPLGQLYLPGGDPVRKQIGTVESGVTESVSIPTDEVWLGDISMYLAYDSVNYTEEFRMNGNVVIPGASGSSQRDFADRIVFPPGMTFEITNGRFNFSGRALASSTLPVRHMFVTDGATGSVPTGEWWSLSSINAPDNNEVFAQYIQDDDENIIQKDGRWVTVGPGDDLPGKDQSETCHSYYGGLAVEQ